jgi:hypothetical protein
MNVGSLLVVMLRSESFVFTCFIENPYYWAEILKNIISPSYVAVVKLCLSPQEKNVNWW